MSNHPGIVNGEFIVPVDDGGELIVRGIDAVDNQVFHSNIGGSFNATRAHAWAVNNIQGTMAEMQTLDTLKMSYRCDLDDRLMLNLIQKNPVDILRESILTFIHWNDGTDILIDGNHRLACCASACGRAGIERFKMKAYVIPFEEAHRFAVTHIFRYNGFEIPVTSTELLSMLTGVYSNEDHSIREDPARRARAFANYLRSQDQQ